MEKESFLPERKDGPDQSRDRLIVAVFCRLLGVSGRLLSHQFDEVAEYDANVVQVKPPGWPEVLAHQRPFPNRSGDIDLQPVGAIRALAMS